MTDRELMQMALEELEELADVGYGSKTVLQALRDRLAQPEPEPVAKYSDIVSDGGLDLRYEYEKQREREWVGLTDGRQHQV